MMRAYRTHLPWILLAGVLITLAVAYLWLHLSTPFDNGRLQPSSNGITAEGLVVTPLESRPQGFRRGDVVTAVDGRNMDAWIAAGSPRQHWEVGQAVRYTVLRGGQRLELEVTLGRYPLGAIAQRNWGTIAFGLLFLPIAAYVFLRRPGVPATRPLFLSAAALFCATTWSLGAQVSDFVDGIGLWLYHLTTIGGFALIWIAGLHFALLFPRPLSVLTRCRWLLPAAYGLPYLVTAAHLLLSRADANGLLDWIATWGDLTSALAFVYLLLTLAVVVWQYRANRAGDAHRQMRWLTFAALIVGGAALVFYFLPPLVDVQAIDSNTIGLIGLAFPLSVATAILRHNLFDIDTLLNRTLVYGMLTTGVVATYVLVVSMLGTIFQARGNTFVAVAATGLVAILFQPLRQRLQRAVNRWMYGDRDEPFDVLARLGQRLEGTLAVERIYPTIVETVALTLKLPYTAIAVRRGDRFETVESYGRPVDDPVNFALTHQGEIVGQLQVALRARDEPFSALDERLIRSIARQAGAVVHAVQLTADLQRSRRQLVTSREEERRRLRRDLHDGLGPSLASLMLKIGSARAILHDDTQAAESLLAEMEADVESTLAEVRRVVYNLRPPELDQLGLMGAIEACARSYVADSERDQPVVTVVGPVSIPTMPAAVEIAAYRIVQEGLTNVMRHAQANQCAVSLAFEPASRNNEGRLIVTIRDDGLGLPGNISPGVGLVSMRERATELGGVCEIEPALGGGTLVRAVLPVQEIGD